MIDRMALFGVTGDLAGRYVLPALARLQAAGELPESFLLVGAARRDADDNALRRFAADKLEEHAVDLPAAARGARRLARRAGATLHVISVVEPFAFGAVPVSTTEPAASVRCGRWSGRSTSRVRFTRTGASASSAVRRTPVSTYGSPRR